MGRMSEYSEAVAETICQRLAEGESLRSICSTEGMPAQSTVFRWLSQQPTFQKQYALAREAQADTLFDDILEISDDARNDWMARRGEDDAGWQANGEHIQRSRLRVDARKWMAGKLAPKKYGEKLDVNHSGSIERTSDDELDARIAQLLGKGGTGEPSGGEGTET
jgi:hypothetical protein